MIYNLLIKDSSGANCLLLYKKKGRKVGRRAKAEAHIEHSRIELSITHGSETSHGCHSPLPTLSVRERGTYEGVDGLETSLHGLVD